VVAGGPNNTPITATVQASGQVSSVSVTNGQASFDLSGISVPISELVTVNPKPSSN
jgi:hypothetical protein